MQNIFKPLRTRTFLVLFIAAVILVVQLHSSKPQASVKNDPLKGTISISGSFALYPMAVKWGEEFKKIHPNVQVDVSAGGAGKGIADTLSGAVDIGTVSRDVFPEEKQKGAFAVAVAKDAVVPTVNTGNPALKSLLTRGVTKSVLANLWVTGKIKTWGELTGTNDRAQIHVYTRSDASGAAETWAKYFGKQQEDLLGIGVFGDPGIAQAVKRDPAAIGYNSIAYVFDSVTKQQASGIRIVPLDLNGNGKIDKEENFYQNEKTFMEAVASGKYPIPPARELYFVTKGRPQKIALREFIKWVLTDGQQYIAPTGYINLSKSKLQGQLKKLG